MIDRCQTSTFWPGQVSVFSLLVPGQVDFCNISTALIELKITFKKKKNQRTNGPVNAHLISWPSKAQNIQNLENIW